MGYGRHYYGDKRMILNARELNVRRIAFPEKTWIDELRAGDVIILPGGSYRLILQVMHDSWGYLIAAQVPRLKTSAFAQDTVGLGRHDLKHAGYRRHNVRVKKLKTC